MTTGTKVFLALFALIVGVLVVYYGMVAPGNVVPGQNTVAASGNGTKDGRGGGGSDDNRMREPDPTRRPVSSAEPDGHRTAPPPRDPAPTAHPTPIWPTSRAPAGASTGGGLLSEGLREAGGDPAIQAGSMQVQPGSDAKAQPISNPYLPLVGLNNGDLGQAANEPSKGKGEPVEAQPQASPATANPASVDGTDKSALDAVDPKPLEPMPERNPGPGPGAPPSQSANAAPTRIAYLIVQGDTFVSIAETWFGDANKWSLIARENPTVDPQKLKIGQKIFLPPKSAAITPAAPEPAVSAGESIYVVQSGDTLIAIARERLGDGAKWESIYELNKATIGSDSAVLKVGMKLRLPKKAN